MIAYASRTGTRRNLEALRVRGWRLIVSATGDHRNEGFPYALDNGAWTAHQQGTPFNESLFEKAVNKLAKDADFVVSPDIVGGGLASLEKSVERLPWLLERTERVLIAVQDGMSPSDLDRLVNKRVGIFLGGTTEFKLKTMPEWGRFAKRLGCYFHVGRVNSVKRIYQCQAAGADSFDGSSISRFACNANRLDHARRQPDFWRIS
jgi:hypothetical protein